MFYRYRHKEAAGPGPWEYIDWDGSEHSLREALSSDPHYNYNDLYRGADIEPVDRPPKEWLLREAKEAKDRSRHEMFRAIRYLELLMGVKSDKDAV